MTYKITVQDGPVSVTVETEVADEAAAVLAVSVLQKVQRSKSFDPPRPQYYWNGPDVSAAELTRRRLQRDLDYIRDSPNRLRGTWQESVAYNPYARAEVAVAKQQP